ncbi:MAG: thioredoxin family protein [Gammaproteobacteria bacterium]|nr:thioredoxin family protein [Gammaproteobacteria bacterium]
MATVEINSDNFESILTQNEIVLIDFWAAWCQPCGIFAPIYEQVSEDYPQIVFGKVDIDAHKEFAAAHKIQSIPTLSLFRERILIFSQAGVLSAAQLQNLVKQAQSLNMDEVRDEIRRQGE